MMVQKLPLDPHSYTETTSYLATQQPVTAAISHTVNSTGFDYSHTVNINGCYHRHTVNMTDCCYSHTVQPAKNYGRHTMDER